MNLQYEREQKNRVWDDNFYVFDTLGKQIKSFWESFTLGELIVTIKSPFCLVNINERVKKNVTDKSQAKRFLIIKLFHLNI